MGAYTLRKIEPKRAAKLLCVIYGAMFFILSLFAAPMLMLVPPEADQPLPKSFALLLIVLYPLFGALMGWITGHVVARIYNFAASKIGGLQFEFEKIV